MYMNNIVSSRVIFLFILVGCADDRVYEQFVIVDVRYKHRALLSLQRTHIPGQAKSIFVRRCELLPGMS